MTPEERAGRERKQKIFVAVGGVLLVLVLVFFTLPKVLGGGSSSPPQAARTDTTSTTSTVPGQVTPPPTGTASPTPAAAAVNVAATTKLSSFSAFRQKDPFVQQVATPEQAAAAAAASSAGSGDAGKAAKGAKDEGSTQKFSVGTKAAATSTIVTVNGARQVVEPGARFPAADPLFVLVAEKPEAKAVVIGVAGGAYSGGDKTTTLKVGRSLTLVNTTTGAKYKISLVSVGSGDQVAEPAKP